MPYFVARQILGSCKSVMSMPVASVGSRADLRDTEGWGRRSEDTQIRIYLDEYQTEMGELRVWYQYPDFYRMNISARDSLFLESSTESATSVIEGLRSFDKLRVKDTLANIPTGDTLYGEVHSIENTRRRSPVTYWYLIRLLSDHRTVALMAPDLEHYPIEQLEINGNPVESFRWRKTP
jgi:hypothetical protein